MKPIKITSSAWGFEPDFARIQAALGVANGKARAHTYTDARDVIAVAQEAERKLDDLGVPKKHRPGTVARADSGSSLPKSYKGRVIYTTLTLRRAADGWTLIKVRRGECWSDQAGEYLHLVISRAARDAAVERLLTDVSVAD